MISAKLVIWLLVCHIIGDCVAQPYSFPENKLRYKKYLLYHCAFYGMALGLLNLNMLFGFVNFILHYMVDFCSTALTRKMRTANKHGWNEHPWDLKLVLLVADQFLHITGLVLTASWLLR